MDEIRKYCSVKEVMARTGMSRSTIERRIDDGCLPYIQIGGPGTLRLIPRDAIDAYLNRKKSPTTTPPEPTAATHYPSNLPRELPGPPPRWLRGSTSP